MPKPKPMLQRFWSQVDEISFGTRGIAERRLEMESRVYTHEEVQAEIAAALREAMNIASNKCATGVEAGIQIRRLITPAQQSALDRHDIAVAESLVKKFIADMEGHLSAGVPEFTEAKNKMLTEHGSLVAAETAAKLFSDGWMSPEKAREMLAEAKREGLKLAAARLKYYGHSANLVDEIRELPFNAPSEEASRKQAKILEAHYELERKRRDAPEGK